MAKVREEHRIMKVIKTKPVYRCDYCNHRAGIVGMTTHEKICWRNPNRWCEYCENKGTVREDYDNIPGALYQDLPCPYCSKFNPLDIGVSIEDNNNQTNITE